MPVRVIEPRCPSCGGETRRMNLRRWRDGGPMWVYACRRCHTDKRLRRVRFLAHLFAHHGHHFFITFIAGVWLAARDDAAGLRPALVACVLVVGAAAMWWDFSRFMKGMGDDLDRLAPHLPPGDAPNPPRQP